MSAKPTIHLTNWSSRKLHGFGRKWTIMARPRSWEHGDGYVGALTPSASDLDLIRMNGIEIDEYRLRCEAKFRQFLLKPGCLRALSMSTWNKRLALVGDGDTLCCACSRFEAAANRCHRCWAAVALKAAGWAVILDGRQL